MRKYPSKPTTFVYAPTALAAEPLPAASSFDVQKLLDHSGTILEREIRNLLSESSSGKLAPNSARDLVQYVKLLSELKAEQVEEIRDKTDEELKAIVPK